MVPIGDKILVKELAPDQISKGGIIIPESAKKRPGKTVIVKVSPDINFPNKDTTLKEDQTILINPECGSPVLYNGDDHLMITHDDVWAIV